MYAIRSAERMCHQALQSAGLHFLLLEIVNLRSFVRDAGVDIMIMRGIIAQSRGIIALLAGAAARCNCSLHNQNLVRQLPYCNPTSMFL